MTTMKDLVAEVRSMLTGSLPNEISVLSEDYVPGSGKIALAYPKRALSSGGMLSVGLNTFQVLATDSAGSVLDVYAQVDGGPDLPMSAGSLVQVKPRFTDWAVFREINGEILSMSSPNNGLYSVTSFTAAPDWTNGTYPLPVTWVDTPIGLLRARYQQIGRDSWQIVRNADWQPEQQVIRIFGPQPQAGEVEFTMAFPFFPADSLDTDLVTLGLSRFNQDIPGLGAASNLLRGSEGRRQQPFSQGDPRRADEVGPGANIGLSREFSRIQRERIDGEHARLLKMFGYQQAIGV